MTQFLTVSDQLFQLNQRTLSKFSELSIAHSGHLAHLPFHITNCSVNPCPDFHLIFLSILLHGRLSQLFNLQTRSWLINESLLPSNNVLLDQDSQLVGQHKGLDGVNIVTVRDCANYQQATKGVMKKSCKEIGGCSTRAVGSFRLFHNFLSDPVYVL